MSRTNSRSKLSTFDQRVTWLLKHREFWYDWHVNNRDYKQAHFSTTMKHLIIRMQDAGLFAKSTYWLDPRMEDELHAATEKIQLGKQKI
jgi:hypothetical protein